jgi:adenylate cyclase
MPNQEESPSQSPAPRDAALSAENIQGQLERILASPEFHATERQQEFLKFVVREAIAGRSQEIKGYTVATRVFGRKEDFDQATDPIVSIHANKLRRALERYYLVAGKMDPVRIDIPKGTYVPTFQTQSGAQSARGVGSEGDSHILFEGSWPTVLVRPFQNLTGDRAKEYLGVGLATELAVEIARFQEIRVSMSRPGQGKTLPESAARFLLDGNIREDRTGIKVTVYLTDAATDKQIWGDSHRSDLEAARLIAFEEDVARVVAAKIAGEHGIIAKAIAFESRSTPPSALKTYEAVLRYYEYDQTLTIDSFSRALASLDHAAEVEPICGQVWTLLGRLHGSAYSLGFPGFETALEKALAFAERGVRLNPHDQRARAVLAFVRMLRNELPAARKELESALALNPNSLIILDGIGYLMTLLGDWERGPTLIRKIIRLNPFYNPVVHYALWVNWIRQAEYEQAYLETLNYNTPSLFWEPLAKAATLGLLGRSEEGKRAAEELLRLKPDFPTRGRVLIGHYIKFAEVFDCVIEGLRSVGVDLA